jgi:hypothetical protein
VFDARAWTHHSMNGFQWIPHSGKVEDFCSVGCWLPSQIYFPHLWMAAKLEPTGGTLMEFMVTMEYGPTFLWGRHVSSMFLSSFHYWIHRRFNKKKMAELGDGGRLGLWITAWKTVRVWATYLQDKFHGIRNKFLLQLCHHAFYPYLLWPFNSS